MSRGEVARLIDHTLLRPEATQHDIEVLCREALDFKFANVCINPTWVTLAAYLLGGKRRRRLRGRRVSARGHDV